MNKLFSAVILALVAVAAVPGAIAAPFDERAAQTNFSATCTGISFNAGNNNLTATCQRSGGIGTTTSTIGLNSGNSFSSSCSSISFSGVSLSALCRNPAGTNIRTTLDLNSVLSNTNGILTCP
ncbi:hypothetical protein DFH06DRAFT_1124544 [Mycena polygramma]|nr:hypothetical protein DFH06DRAFT_1124544 [Mycena polygramma]